MIKCCMRRAKIQWPTFTKWEGRIFTRTCVSWTVNKAFAAGILLEVNTVRAKTQLVVLTEQ